MAHDIDALLRLAQESAAAGRRDGFLPFPRAGGKGTVDSI